VQPAARSGRIRVARRALCADEAYRLQPSFEGLAAALSYLCPPDGSVKFGYPGDR